MASSRKYAALPDLDSAPDLYETPELADDLSTVPPARVDANGVDFSDRIHAKRRSYKTSSRRRRRKHRAPEEEQDGVSEDEEEEDESESDEEEGLQRRIARLRREVEEVKAEVRRRNEEKGHGDGAEDETEHDEDEEQEQSGVAQLSKVLTELQASNDDVGGTPEARILSRLGRPLPGLSTAKNQVPSTAPSQAQPSSAQTLSQATSSFDTRLALIEKALGISSSSTIYSFNDDQPPRPILPTLEALHGRITSLAGASPVSLDALAGRVRQLTEEEKTLEKVQNRRHRRSSSASTRSLSPSLESKPADQLTLQDLQAIAETVTLKSYEDRLRGLTRKRSTTTSKPPETTARDKDKDQANGSKEAKITTTTTTTTTSDDAATAEAPTALSLHPQTYAKVKALYRALPTLERLSPMLPPLLERLHSLRAVHANAARASDALDALERSQHDTAQEMARWRDGLDQVEARMREGEELLKANVHVVEGWVKEIEERMRKMQTHV